MEVMCRGFSVWRVARNTLGSSIDLVQDESGQILPKTQPWLKYEGSSEYPLTLNRGQGDNSVWRGIPDVDKPCGDVLLMS